MKIKNLIIFSVVLIGLGLIISTITFAAAGFSFTKVAGNNKDYTKKEVSYSKEGIKELNIESDSYEIIIKNSNDDKFYVTYYESEAKQIEIKKKSKSIKIESKADQDEWIREITKGIFSSIVDTKHRTITVFVPKDFEGDIKTEGANSAISLSDLGSLKNIKLGNLNALISVKNVNCGDLIISNRSALIKIDRLNAKNVSITGTNGTVNVFHTKAEKKLNIENKNGVVEIQSLESADIKVNTTNGVVTGTILGNESEYFIDSQVINGVSGLKNNPDNTLEKRLEVKTTNAVINIRFVKK